MAQLSAKGLQDQLLFGYPSDTDFYKPATPFGANPFIQKFEKTMNVQSIHKEIMFTNRASFDHQAKCIIPYQGAFIQDIYLQIRLPKLVKTDGSYAAWANGIGNALIHTAVLQIGGVTVDTLTRTSLDILDETEYADEASKRRSFGKFEVLNYVQTALVYGSNEEVLQIPLRFFFTSDISKSLPIAAMASSEVVVLIDFAPFEECLCYDGSTPPVFADLVAANLLVNFHNIDQAFMHMNVVNKRFVYLIDQVQVDSEYIAANMKTFQVDLKFKNPVRSLYWAFLDEVSADNNDWFNYLSRIDQNVIMTDAKLDFEDSSVSDWLPEIYFRLVQAGQYTNVITDKSIYQMQFGTNPSKNSGSVNFSRLDKATLHVKLRAAASNPCRIVLVAKSWNFLLIENGFASIMFAC